MKKVLLLVVLLMAIVVSGCSTDADVASHNLSLDADNFKITRRIVFYDGINAEYLLVIEGKCSLGNQDVDGELSVTCKVGDNAYKKHFLGLSDNVTYIVEQIDAVYENPYHYEMIFKPETIVPEIEIKTSGD